MEREPGPPTLPYFQPPTKGRLARFLRRLPKPSRLTLVLLVLTIAAACWLKLDHAAWTITRTFDGIFLGPSAISRDGTRLALALDDRTLRIYHITTGRTLCDLTRPAGNTLSAAFAPDGNRLLSLGSDQQAILFEIPSAKQIVSLPVNRELHRLADIANTPFTPDGRWLALPDKTGDNFFLRIHDAHTGKPLAELESDGLPLNFPQFSPDGELLAAAAGAQTVVIWQTQTWKRLATLSTAAATFTISSRHLAFAPDSSQLFIARTPDIEIWDRKTNTAARLLTIRGQLSGIELSRDGRYLVTTNANGPDELFDLHTRTLVGPLTPFGSQPKLSPDGTRIAAYRGVGAVPSLEQIEAINGDGRIAWLPNSQSFLTQEWVPLEPKSVKLFHRRRPEALHGYLYLPQFWALILCSILLVWRITKDIRHHRRFPASL